MSILNFGSINIDRVFRVEHIARAGETIAGTSFPRLAGGKGANQSVALARAGAQVAHLGMVGGDGAWLIEKLTAEGIDTRWVQTSSEPTGQAMIQVDRAGQNAIVLDPGANRQIAPSHVDRALASLPKGAWLLVQNETSAVDYAMAQARQHKVRVAFNPAPCDAGVCDYGWEQVDLLCLNEIEGAALADCDDPEQIVAALAARAPQAEIVLTLGAAGVLYRDSRSRIRLAACAVTPLDTTAAGDTFLGYYLAARSQGRSPRDALETANRAAALCVTRPGAMDSIPRRDEVERWPGPI
ncbi:MAG TPA: ribokinase [Pirellulales bacterium]|nr:ribokinase [Pirellulales bacterium]